MRPNEETLLITSDPAPCAVIITKELQEYVYEKKLKEARDIRLVFLSTKHKVPLEKKLARYLCFSGDQFDLVRGEDGDEDAPDQDEEIPEEPPDMPEMVFTAHYYHWDKLIRTLAESDRINPYPREERKARSDDKISADIIFHDLAKRD
jgi:hypothetical protein